MNALRNHWFDLGGMLALALGAWLATRYANWPAFPLLCWLNLLALLLFAPLVGWLGYLAAHQPLATPGQWALGVGLGLALNYLGIIKLINWLANPQSTYRLEPRQLLPGNTLTP